MNKLCSLEDVIFMRIWWPVSQEESVISCKVEMTRNFRKLRRWFRRNCIRSWNHEISCFCSRVHLRPCCRATNQRPIGLFGVQGKVFLRSKQLGGCTLRLLLHPELFHLVPMFRGTLFYLSPARRTAPTDLVWTWTLHNEMNCLLLSLLITTLAPLKKASFEV